MQKYKASFAADRAMGRSMVTPVESHWRHGRHCAGTETRRLHPESEAQEKRKGLGRQMAAQSHRDSQVPGQEGTIKGKSGWMHRLLNRV